MYRCLCRIQPRSRITYCHTVKAVCIEQCVILREFFHTNNIFKADLLKCLIPWFRTSLDIRIPFDRHQTVDIEHQLFDWPNQLATAIGSRVGRLDTPAFCIAYTLHFLSCPWIITFQLCSQSQTWVSQARSHRLLGQNTKHFSDDCCQRYVFVHIVCSHQRMVDSIWQLFTYTYMIFWSRYTQNSRFIRLQRMIARHESIVSVSRCRRERFGKSRSLQK